MATEHGKHPLSVLLKDKIIVRPGADLTKPAGFGLEMAGDGAPETPGFKAKSDET